jgi:DNA repair protein RadC
LEKSRCHTKDPPLHRNVLFRFRQAQVLSRSKLVWFTLSRCGRHPRAVIEAAIFTDAAYGSS